MRVPTENDHAVRVRVLPALAGDAFKGAHPLRGVVQDDPLLSLLPKARRRWARTDPVMARLAREHAPESRSIEFKEGFPALVESITHQQVSLAAGRAIHSRVEAACAGRVTPEAILKAGPDSLRACGLSRSKSAYALDLAERAARGDVDFARFPAMTDEEVIETLTAVKGIGVWTAKMFLIFHLHRPDVLAPEDLGLRIAVAAFYGVPPERAAAEMLARGPAWSPFASVAALVLWSARRAVGADGAMAPRG